MLLFGAVQVHRWTQSGWWYRAFVMTLNIRIYTLIDRILKTISNIKFHKLLGNNNVITIFFTNSWEHKIHGADRVQTQDKDSTFWRILIIHFVSSMTGVYGQKARKLGTTVRTNALAISLYFWVEKIPVQIDLTVRP